MRKDTLITIIMGVISIFTSCNPHPNLSKADQLINFYPDSSLTYLKAIQHPENMFPKDYAKWCLLVAQAKYNNAQSLVPDSFVFKAFDYPNENRFRFRRRYSGRYLGYYLGPYYAGLGER